MADLIQDIARFKRAWGELVDLRRKPPARIEETFDDLPRLVDLRVEVVALLKDLAGAMEVRKIVSTPLWDLHDYFDSPSDDQWAAVVTALNRLGAQARTEGDKPVLSDTQSKPGSEVPTVKWSDPASHKTWARCFDVSERTLRRWTKEGFRMKRLPGTTGKWGVDTSESAYVTYAASLEGEREV